MKRWIAMLLAVAVLGLFAACGDAAKDPAEPATTAETTIDLAAEASGATEPASLPADAPADESSTTSVAESASSIGETTADAGKTLAGEEALKLFNDATKLAVTQKAGYKKTRYTKITDLDFGLLGQFDLVKEVVHGFFDVGLSGEGTLKKEVAKGTSSDLLRASTWKLSDVKSATAVPDGNGGYNVTILIKDGVTRWTGEGGKDPGKGTLNSPVDKGPLCYGEDDDSKYDHKTAKNIYLAINLPDNNANTKDIGERSYNIKCEAKIDSQGRLQRLYGYLEMTVEVNHVQYLFVTLNNKAGSGYGEVVYEDFKY